jgi:hypothetical protein
MDQFKFKSEHNKMIVDAIVEGYRDYIEHRKDRKAKMKISSAFAWTKGNYQISEIMHYLPNPTNNIAYQIEDLSSFISGADLTEEEREVVAPEMNEDIMDPAAFDIGILEEEQHN